MPFSMPLAAKKKVRTGDPVLATPPTHIDLAGRSARSPEKPKRDYPWTEPVRRGNFLRVSINRRKVLGGAGLAGAAAATGVGVDHLVSGYRTDKDVSLADDASVGDPRYPMRRSLTDKDVSLADDAARFGDPRLPDETITSHSHLFHLGAQPLSSFDGGSFQQADEENFPILKGQEASIVSLTLQPGGIREPHWHPSAWEINIVTKGVASWALVDGNGNHESFDQKVGDVVFAPQGSFHYFENRGPGDMKIVIVQNTSAPEAKDNIGIGESISRLPPRVLSAIFGVPEKTFNSFKKIDEAIVVLRKH